jgi:hypothetical protein
MSHVRKQIRDAYATALTGLTTTGANVFKGRYYQLQNAKLPALLIYTSSEAAEINVMGSSRGSDRLISVTVEGYAKSSGVVEDTLDQIAVEVEEAIAADVTFSGIAKDTTYTGFELDASADPEQTVAAMRITFVTRYRVAEDDVETAI